MDRIAESRYSLSKVGPESMDKWVLGCMEVNWKCS